MPVPVWFSPLPSVDARSCEQVQSVESDHLDSGIGPCERYRCAALHARVNFAGAFGPCIGELHAASAVSAGAHGATQTHAVIENAW